MKRRVLASMLSVVLSVGLLAGCGGDSGSTGSDSSSGSSDKDVKLSVFDAKAYGTEEFDAILADYGEKNGLSIEVQHSPNDYDALVMSRFNSDDIPDILALQVGSSAQQYYEYAYDWSDDTEVLELFNEDAIATGKDADGNVMSLPGTYETMGLLYNKDLFEQAGITELPATISEMEAVCEKLTAAGITPFAVAGKELWVLHQLASNFMMDKSLEAQGVADQLNSGELTFEELPNYKNLFPFLDLVIKYGSEKQLEYDWETSENMLANGEAAMIQMGDWCQATMDEFNPDANLGFIPCPVSENPEDATLLSSVSWTYIVNKDSEHLEEAKELLTFMLTSDEMLDWMCNVIGNVPAAQGEFEVKGDLANEAAGYISAGKTNGWIHTLAPTGFQDEAGAAYQNYMLGNASAEETTKLIQELWNE